MAQNNDYRHICNMHQKAGEIDIRSLILEVNPAKNIASH